MPGYSYLSGVGGMQGGQQQAGPAQMPPSMMSQSMPGGGMTSPNLFGTASQSGMQGGMAGGGMGSGYNQSGLNPSTQNQYQQNSVFVPGFGYMNGNNFTNQSLNSNYIQNPQYANNPYANINAINSQMGGYQMGSNQAGLGNLSGVQTNYGLMSPSMGGGNGLQGLGQSFTFGANQYQGNQTGVNQALSGYNSLVNANDPALGQATSLQGAYGALQGNASQLNNPDMGNAHTAFNPYFTDPSMLQYTSGYGNYQGYGGISPQQGASPQAQMNYMR